MKNTRHLPFYLLIILGVALLAPHSARADTIDADVNLTVKSGNVTAGVIAEGRLKLTSNTITPTKYSGTFIDNLDAGRAFTASADKSNTSAPVLTIATHAGKFIFTMDQGFGTSLFFSQSTTLAPSSLKNYTFQLGGKTHQFTTEAYAASFSFGGPFAGDKSNVEGTLVLIKDASNFVAPKDPSTHSISYLAIPDSKGKILRTPLTAPSYFGRYGGGFFGDANHLTINLKLNGRYVAFEAEYDSGSVEYVGAVFKPGAGSAAANGVVKLIPGAQIP